MKETVSSTFVLILAADPSRRSAVKSFLQRGRGLRVEDRGNVPRTGVRPDVVVLDVVGARRPSIAEVRSALDAPILGIVDSAESALDLGVDDWVLDGSSLAPWEVRIRRLAGRKSSRPKPALPEQIRRMISHDLRSPLAIILGQCELLESGIRGDLTERQLDSVARITRQAERLGDMVEEVRKSLLVPGTD